MVAFWTPRFCSWAVRVATAMASILARSSGVSRERSGCGALATQWPFSSTADDDGAAACGARPAASREPQASSRYIPKREDLAKEFGGGFNAQKRAIDSVQPDDVVVMEARGEHGTGTLGDVLALRAQVNGANAVITDGGIRDSAAVAEVGLQVYAGATHPAVLGRRHIPWEVGGTIACGGTTVQPGDIIVGDDDGVVVIPPSLLQEVVDDAYEQELQDAWAYEQVKAGYPVDGMFPPNAEWKAKFAEYRKTLPDAPAPEGDA